MKRRLGALAILLATGTVSATILHFDSEPAPGVLFSDYGDRVSMSPDASGHTYGMGLGWTPHVEMEYRPLDPATRLAVPLAAPGVWGGGYGDLDHVAWSGLGPVGMLEVEFRPHPGYAVVVHSFDAAGFAFDQTNQPIYFADATNTIVADLTANILGPPTHSTFAGITHYGMLKLQIGNTWNVGVDNISITEILVLPGDMNHDCVVNLADLGVVLANFGRSDPTAFDGDLDGDGDVDIGDLGVILSAFGSSC